jgi:uncharacterized membrane protein YdjX (TVP38/TMEM64 family)
MENVRRRPLVSVLAFPLLIFAILVCCFVFRSQIALFLRDRELLRAWILSFGMWGPAVFVALQALQVIVFVVPGEFIQIAGGYVFGLWLGSLYTVVGIIIGSTVNFFAGRILGRPFVESIFDKSKIESVERITGSGKGAAGFFLLYLIPGMPIKDLLCYVAGISTLKLFVFLGVSMMGRLPGIVGSALIGDAAYGGRWTLALIVFGAAAALFALGLVFKERIQKTLTRILHKSNHD